MCESYPDSETFSMRFSWNRKGSLKIRTKFIEIPFGILKVVRDTVFPVIFSWIQKGFPEILTVFLWISLSLKGFLYILKSFLDLSK